jgi:hypothetical protein
MHISIIFIKYFIINLFIFIGISIGITVNILYIIAIKWGTILIFNCGSGRDDLDTLMNLIILIELLFILVIFLFHILVIILLLKVLLAHYLNLIIV